MASPLKGRRDFSLFVPQGRWKEACKIAQSAMLRNSEVKTKKRRCFWIIAGSGIIRTDIFFARKSRRFTQIFFKNGNHLRKSG